MAYILCDFYSRSLGKDTVIHMIFPEYGQIGKKKIKICTLLHGQSQDASFWIRRTNIADCRGREHGCYHAGGSEKLFRANAQ